MSDGKLPRNIDADRLVSALKRLGYQLVRQRGSHIRMQHPGPPRHKITIPKHSPLKVGTLQAILAEVAQQRSLTIEELVASL